MLTLHGRDRDRDGELELRRRAGVLPDRRQLRQQRAPTCCSPGARCSARRRRRGSSSTTTTSARSPNASRCSCRTFEDKLYRLGIPAKTHHNEVAPGQFEIAPYFEAANVAADHQQLMMTIMKTTAKDTASCVCCTRSRSPGVNGSGKHVNWSVGNSTQGNLLDPGELAAREPQLPVVLRRRHPRRASVRPAAARRDRLGRQRPPPRRQRSAAGDPVGVPRRPARGRLQRHQGGQPVRARQGRRDGSRAVADPAVQSRDPGDRNRTSPFAFTGNRFEFRAVGSSQSVSGPLVAMNTMLADSLGLDRRQARGRGRRRCHARSKRWRRSSRN